MTTGIAFYNDDVVSRDLMVDGYSLEDAMDYSISGYAEPTGARNNNSNTSSNFPLGIAVLETALHEGRKSASGWQRIGLATTLPTSQSKTFEDVENAFADQLEYFAGNYIRRADVRDEVVAEMLLIPLLSATVEGYTESVEHEGESI